MAYRHMNSRRPLSTGGHTNGSPLSVEGNQDGGPTDANGRVETPYHDHPDDVDPRKLFATAFWGHRGHRRFSDPAAQLPRRWLTADALRQLNMHNGDGDGDDNDNGNGNRHPYTPFPSSTTPPPSEPYSPPTPTSTRSAQDPRRRSTPTQPPQFPPSPSRRRSYRYPTPSLTSDTSSTISSVVPPRPFFHCPGYTPHAIQPRTLLPLPTRREELVEGLSLIEVKGFKSVGQLARPLLNKSHSSKLLTHFLHHAPRTILLPTTPTPPSYRPGAVVPAVQPPIPTQRELSLLESELFDTSKYISSAHGTDHLTVLTWNETDKYGTITLFEVDVEQQPLPPQPSRRTLPHGHIHAAATLTRHHAPPSPNPHRWEGDQNAGSSSTREVVVGLRPFAAMEDTPRQVLVQMRVDGAVKKAVLRQHEHENGRLRWTAQHTRLGRRPCYARAWDRGGYGVRGGGAATVVGGGECESGGRWRRGVRLEMEEADGVVASVPQFLALLHASRSTIETVTSSTSVASVVDTEEGESVRAVALASGPVKGVRHTGRDVHVVVLVPDGAKWAEERIFWTDAAGGLAEMRRNQYRDVIEGRRTRGRGRRDWDERSLSPRSPPLSPRTTRW